MPNILIVYSDRSGHTELMAYAIAQGAKEAQAEVTVKHVRDTNVKALLEADAIILGSPTYYGLPSSDIKKLLEESVVYHGELEGKVGGAFSSSANIAGGNETTILALIQAMLVHGMILKGSVTGNHYGPVSVNAPDHRVRNECFAYGKQVAALAKELTKEKELPTVELEK